MMLSINLLCVVFIFLTSCIAEFVVEEVSFRMAAFKDVEHIYKLLEMLPKDKINKEILEYGKVSEPLISKLMNVLLVILLIEKFLALIHFQRNITKAFML